MSVSLSSIIQYTVFGIFAYILAGAPLLSIFSSNSHPGVKTQLSAEQAETLVFPEQGLECPEHKYAVNILSREPLVVYIEGFLSDEEAKHVVRMRWVLSFFSCLFSLPRSSSSSTLAHVLIV
jgi:prolyl 4-hydroxylase